MTWVDYLYWPFNAAWLVLRISTVVFLMPFLWATEIFLEWRDGREP